MDAIRNLRAAVDQFCRYVRSLGDVPPKAWGPREVLAHLIFWQESYLLQTEAILFERTFDLPIGSFDELNARAAEASRDVPTPSLIAQFRHVNARLSTVARKHHPDRITIRLKKGSSHIHPLSWYLRYEAEHIRHHLHELQNPRDPEAVANALREAADNLGATLIARPTLLPESLPNVVALMEYYAAQLDGEVEPSAPEALAAEDPALLLSRYDWAIEHLVRAMLICDPQDTLLTVFSGRSTHIFTLDYALERITKQLGRWRRQWSR